MHLFLVYSNQVLSPDVHLFIKYGARDLKLKAQPRQLSSERLGQSKGFTSSHHFEETFRMKAIWKYFNAEQLNLLITLKSRDSEHKDSTHHNCDFDH